MKHDYPVDWHSVTERHRNRIVHILIVLGVIAGYALLMPAYEVVKRWGLVEWWEPLSFWVLIPFWLLTVGTLAMSAPKLIFFGLPTPWKDYEARDEVQEPRAGVKAAPLPAEQQEISRSSQSSEGALMAHPWPPAQVQLIGATRELATQGLLKTTEPESATSEVKLEAVAAQPLEGKILNRDGVTTTTKAHAETIMHASPRTNWSQDRQEPELPKNASELSTRPEVPSLKALEAAAMMRLAEMVKDSPTKPSEKALMMAAKSIALKAVRELEAKAVAVKPGHALRNGKEAEND